MRLYRASSRSSSTRVLLNVPNIHLMHQYCSHNVLNTRYPGDVPVGVPRAGQTDHSTYKAKVSAHMPVVAPGSSNKLRRSSQYTSQQQQTIDSMHWLFRTNIPRRRSSYYPNDKQKRNFFGIGEIVGVLTNPAETVRSLTESKRLLEEARQEINDNRERAQIRPKHTFSRLPGFFSRPAEIKAIEKILEGHPAFTVLFGASSTALLREVLCSESYHVLHFDLRIAGFADLASLYMSLSRQMEQYFEAISTQMEGYKEFEKEAWSFKHDRLNVERRMTENYPDSGINRIMTSDVARLMELFQSSLLKYWEFDPLKEEEQNKRDIDQKSKASKKRGVDDLQSKETSKSSSRQSRNLRNIFHLRGKSSAHSSQQPVELEEKELEQERRKGPTKKMPVIFFDEAHKLPALIQSAEAMNCLLSAFLVLTKQDRLCHVIHATSDPFYHTWLRQLNVMQHCKVLTIGDCSKAETREFFRERIMPRVPENIRHGLNFETLYDAFGGKLVHWQDFVTDYVNSNGRLHVQQSSHFIQAHALLNLHLLYSSETSAAVGEDSPTADPNTNLTQHHSASEPVRNLRSSGFKIYSPISNPRSPFASGFSGPTTDATDGLSSYHEPDFTSAQLLKVMSRITEYGTTYLPYFALCRELGVQAVDGMVKGRVLDLKWTNSVTEETEPEEASYLNRHSRPFSIEGAVSSGQTVVNTSNHAATVSEEDMVPVSEGEVYRNPRRRNSRWRDTSYTTGGAETVLGPKLFPTTPIMKYAMREVLYEYDDAPVEDDDESQSEYASAASLSDVEEY
ncbi:hypothetical protein D9757_000843 [Collybiopsis confluens]|uniref:Uncharacterized protein n=1 Tax=Collybiopsis confluens TaxID=2823264 RepID=A0A8H5MFP5_9AGAR|nr:hypothetical protein D9757_000843 [Collybiopsis confluens]